MKNQHNVDIPRRGVYLMDHFLLRLNNTTSESLDTFYLQLYSRIKYNFLVSMPITL